MSHLMTVTRAVVWNILTGVTARIVGLVGTLVLARFLSPGEYGEVSTAAICAMTASRFSNLQFAQYIIMKGSRDPDVAFHAALYHVSLGWLAIFVVFLARDPLGSWLGAPAMAQFLGGFALASAVEVLAIVPEKTLARDLRFRVIALTRGVGEILYVTVALLCVSTFGGMALVLGAVSRSLVVMLAFVVAADRHWCRPARLSWITTRDMLKYSSPLALANMTDFATTRWDNLLIGKLHGTEVMGTYNLAYNLSQTSALTVADHIADVLFPSFSRVEPRQRGQALVRAVSAMVLVVSPLAFGLAVVAPHAVAALLPAKWSLVAPMLMVLSVHSAAQPGSWAFAAFYKTQGRTTFVMTAGIIRLLVLLAGIITIGRLGPLWACAAVNVGFVTHLVFMWSGLRRDHAAFMWPIARGVLQALVACVPMIGCVLLLRALEGVYAPVPPLLALCLEIPAGALGYAIGAAVFARATSQDLIGLFRSLVTPTRPPAGQEPRTTV